jgi:hypothetical protein
MAHHQRRNPASAVDPGKIETVAGLTGQLLEVLELGPAFRWRKGWM